MNVLSAVVSIVHMKTTVVSAVQRWMEGMRMAEYIERGVLLKAVEKMDRLDKETKTKYEYDKEGYILLLKNAPAADVVPVVRCKDCKYYKRFKGCGNWCHRRIRSDIEYRTKPNDFCSYGERRVRE